MTPPQNGSNFEQYKTQAKDLLKQARLGLSAAIERLRTHHPEGEYLVQSTNLQLADAQIVIARENDFTSWTKLKEYVLLFNAIEMLDAGEATRLQAILEKYPAIVKYRTDSGDFGYFAYATLLHHVAGNPIRCPLPDNILTIAAILLSHGANPNALCGVPGNTSSTIGLLLTSKQASEAGVSVTLIDMLKAAGAVDNVDLNDPEILDRPIWNAGIETARELVRRGAKMGLPQAAALGRTDVLEKILAEGDVQSNALEVALTYASSQGEEDCARLLISHGAKGDVLTQAGKEVPSYAARATALHVAAWNGQKEIVKLLLANEAEATVIEPTYKGTALGWAQHGGHVEIAQMLERHLTDHRLNIQTFVKDDDNK